MPKAAQEYDQAVAEAKARGCRVMKAVMDGQTYVYRSLDRNEWKMLKKKAFAASEDDDGMVSASKAMQYREESEDTLVQMAVLHPVTNNLDGWPAGIVPRLVEMITKLSGFEEVEVETEEL